MSEQHHINITVSSLSQPAEQAQRELPPIPAAVQIVLKGIIARKIDRYCDQKNAEWVKAHPNAAEELAAKTVQISNSWWEKAHE